jgi:hypothetical protein
LFGFACQEITGKHSLEYIGDFKAIGKGWSLVNNILYPELLKIAQSKYGLWMIAHSKEKEVSDPTVIVNGKAKFLYNKHVPQLPEQASKQITGLVDMILFVDLYDKKIKDENGNIKKDSDGNDMIETIHAIRTKPSKFYEAGDRSGVLPAVMELDFQKFASIYNKGIAAKAAIEAVNPLPTAKEKINTIRQENATNVAQA